MAITSSPYGAFLTELVQGGHDLMSDDVRVALYSTAYTPDVDNDATTSDLTGEVADEGFAGGYVTGGELLLNKTVAYNSGSNQVVLTADPADWATLTATFRYAVIHNGTNNMLIGYIDYGEDRTFAAEPFHITFASGVVALAAVVS